MDLDTVLEWVLRDEAFYRHTGGGVTLSGGEALLQAEFCRALFLRLRRMGIHTAVETAGYVARRAVEQVAEVTDLFLYDIKAITPELHRRWTGVDNGPIQANLEWLAGQGKMVIARVPLIPDVNDGEEFQHIVQRAVELGIQELHILPYHTVGVPKYEQVGLAYPMDGWREDNEVQIQTCSQFAQDAGLRVSVGGAGF